MIKLIRICIKSIYYLSSLTWISIFNFLIRGLQNFVPFILADTAIESGNSSTKKDGPDTEPNGTQILVD